MGSAWWQCAACLRAQEEDVCELQLNHCNLYDVPPDVFIYERTLEKLYLDANRIKDLPRPLFQCHELKVLSLSDNEISTLPPAIASLINLEYLDLSKNNIKELPDSIKECKSLCFIDISVNPFERFPDAITHIVGLCELYINDAYIEYLPANFGRLSALRTLELRENNMMTLPKSMSRLVNLERLDIGNNDFTELPEVVGDLINLTELWIDGNDIRRIPTSIEQLYRLNHFDCTMNAVHVLPSEIQGWRDISIMNLSSNELYQLPDSLCFLRTVVTLKIDDNQLNSLPNDIGQMSSLEELILTKNFLEYLPPSIGLLRKLHCLNADNNYLRCLPPEIGSCTALSLLSLRSNNLTRVPPELGHLSSLRVLNLVNNYIKFLPVSMLNLTNLKALWLSDNQSQPLVPLQQEFNNEEEMMVLGCFMLPQKPRQDLEQMTHAIGPISSSIIGTGRRICFAAEVETELPRQLQRAPTPYPKELRNLARHARNLHHQTVHDQKMQLEKDTIIKEAKIAKSSGNLDILSKACSTVLVPPDDRHSSENYTNTTPMGSEVHYTNSEESSDEASKTVLAQEKSPDIREAKYIRNPTSDYMIKVTNGDDDYVSPPWKPEECTKASAAFVVESEKLAEPYRNGFNVMDRTCKEQRMDGQVSKMNGQQLPLVPPPYHIAAVFSKKAAFFQQLSPASQLDSHSVLSSAASNSDDVSQKTQKDNDKGEPQRTMNNDQPIDIGTILKNGVTDCSARIEQLDGPFEIVNDVDRILDNDRSYKPSKIPILKAKHVDSIHADSEYSAKNTTCTSNDRESPRTTSSCNIPTSPITGKKYRSPVSARSKYIDRSKVEPTAASLQNCRDISTGESTTASSPNSDVRANARFPDELAETLANVICGNTVSAESRSNSVIDDVGDTGAKDCKVPARNNAPSLQERKPMLNWMFGPHRNANVLPVRVKKNPGLGFSIAGGVAGSETGIIVTKVNPDGPAQGTLRPGDKILEVDGIDFTKSDHNNAVAVLRATGAVVSMMISRHQ